MKIIHTLCLAIAFLSSHSYARTTIIVNTANDENGENAAKCSLREAIQAVNTQQAFGGCISGDRFGTNIIALENATYKLTKGEIAISHEVTIRGTNAFSDEIDSITGNKKRLPPTTQIDGNFSRVFNTTSNSSLLSLENLMVTHGKADLGGAILAGGQISLTNTVFTENEAIISGGAIYLSGRGSALNSTESTFSKNIGMNGAVIGMSCTDYLSPVTRSVTISRSSLIRNGNLSDNSIIEACGRISMYIETSTIAQNIAQANGGILNFVNNIDSMGSLTLIRVTAVENKNAPVLSYGKLGNLAIGSSVIAFNDFGCSAKNGSSTLYNGGNSSGGSNTIQNCSLPLSTTTLSTDIDLDDAVNSDANFANEFNLLANYGGYTDVYLPKLSSKYILNRSNATFCEVDQRGSETPQNESTEICDIGSVERRNIVTISDITKVTSNKDGTNRVSEVDALANSRPSENDSSRGDFGKDPVTSQYLIELTSNPNNQCSILHREGKPPLIRFDNSGVILTDSQSVTCKYRFKDSNGNTSNEGQLRFKTTNKLPIANNDEVTLPSGASLISIDLLSNDNDKNDGIYGGLCTDTNNVLCNGLYIRLVSEPTLGVIEAERSGNCPDNSDLNKYRCYGGKITYRVKNAGSPFDDKFTYVVYDVDKAASNEATVTIINQAGAAEASNSGSLGWLSLFTLGGLAAYRRLRKSHVA